jgi:retron-type reverse transcriptase
MLAAYDLTRKDGAPGIDGVTATDYEAHLEANLLERIKSGRYEAPPVRRVYISKVDVSRGTLFDSRVVTLFESALAAARSNSRDAICD